jgi:hypothetical protein
MKMTKNGMKREDKSAKLNYLDYLDPHVLERYARHMKKGELAHGRGNWKKGGYPLEEYLESAFRHFVALWANFERSRTLRPGDEDHAAALLFNVIAFMREGGR